MSAHQVVGDARMKGMLGTKNAAIIRPVAVATLRGADPARSCHRRINKNGAITKAICFTAIARPSVTQLVLGWRYQMKAVMTRKKAQTLSVQLPAITKANKLNGTRLTLFNRAGASPNMTRIDRTWKMKTTSRTS